MWYGIYKEAAKNPLTEDQMLQIAIDYENGMPTRDIFGKYGIWSKDLQKVLNLLDVKKRGRPEKLRDSSRSRYDETTIKKITEEYKSGVPATELCLKYEIDTTTLYSYLKKYNVEPTGSYRNPYRKNNIKQRILELYRVVKSPIQVSKELGISKAMVYKILEEANEPRLHERRTKRPLADENQYVEMSQRYESGEGYANLADEYGVNENDFKRRLIDEGVYDFSRNSHQPQLSESQLIEAEKMTEYMPTIDVAKYFGVNYSVLKRLLDARGFRINKNDEALQIVRDRISEGKKLIPLSEYGKILNLFEGGMKIREISKLYGMNDATIGNILEIAKRNREQQSQVPVQASFNLRRLLQASYSNEIGYLNRYLKEGFDPNDYEFELKTYLENQGQEFDEDLEYYDIAQEWLGKASKEDLEKFKKWVQNRPPSDMTDSPAYEAMSYNSFVKPTWLVHFTDDPYSIAKEGFKYGHEDTHGLALTTWYTNEARKRHAGYNFAFKVGSRDARICARQNKYGKHAVVFWGAGVEAYHSGDEEDQIIIWGPSVNTNLIFPVLNEEGSWVVNDWRNDKLLIKDDDFDKVSSWVVNNNQMLQQIRSKKT